MFLKKLAGYTTALLAAASATAVFADPVPLTIYHSWSTPSEMAALNVLKTNLAKNNIGWNEIAIPHDTGANVSLTNMVTGGNPPNVFMNSDPGIIRDLAKQGLILDLTQFMNDNKIAQNFPPTVLKEVTVDGKIYKAPAGIH
ncbi:MAG: ABC transporter substrate-binding protein, partial [Devosia sp.]